MFPFFGNIVWFLLEFFFMFRYVIPRNRKNCHKTGIEEMRIARDIYLEKLERGIGNGMIKVITGIRRCGKSYLLFELFREYLFVEK